MTKRRRRKAVRISGVVRTMDLARRRLAEGLPESETEDFVGWVSETVTFVEQTCQQYGITPNCLPASTYRAYEFLRSVIRDLESGSRGSGKRGSEPRPACARQSDAQPARLGKPRTQPAPAQQAWAWAPAPPASGPTERPGSRPGGEPGPKRMRVSNVVGACIRLQAVMSYAAMEAAATGKRGLSRELAGWSRQVKEIAGQVERLCQREGAALTDLPEPSLRAYQWLKFLSDRKNLEAHAAALLTAARIATPVASGLDPEPVVRIEFYNHSVLYRARFSSGGLQRGGVLTLWPDLCITGHEGFITASPAIIEALLRIAVDDLNASGKLGKGGARGERGALGKRDTGGKRGTGGKRAAREHDLALIREYADSEAFREVVAALEAGAAGQGPGLEEALQPSGAGRPSGMGRTHHQARGRHHDLDEAFRRVNEAYFDGRLERPRLTWNGTITHRKLGHYQAATDTVMISITLDDATVPGSVVEFVMYHELLHKHLGTRVIKGRRYAHSAAFRQAEKRFRHYDQAQSFLTNLGRRMRLD